LPAAEEPQIEGCEAPELALALARHPLPIVPAEVALATPVCCSSHAIFTPALSDVVTNVSFVQ